MPLSQDSVSDVRVQTDNAELIVDWSSTSPSATFQVYVDRRLAWYGRALRCRVPRPAGSIGRNIWVEVATVDPAEASRDLSSSLVGPAGAGDRASLTWIGGTYLDPTGLDDVAGFRIFGSAAPGGPVDSSGPIAEVPAYPGGWISDGFGLGGFGQGGFGRAAGTYRWLSEPLPAGTWQFAVVAVDSAGNTRTPGRSTAVTLTTAPRPPAPGPGGTRLRLTYDGPVTRRAMLNWLPSPT